MKWLIIVILQYYIWPTLVAQSPLFSSVNLENDVRPIYTNDMQSDAFGNIWFASNRGLYRIDGYKGYFYSDNPNDTLSLMHNNVFSTYTDWNAAVWIATDKGVQKYLPKRDGFQKIASNHFESLNELYSLSIYAIMQISDSTYFFGGKNGLKVYNAKTDQIEKKLILTPEKIKDGFSTNEHVFKIVRSNENAKEYFILSRSGVYQISMPDLQVTKIDLPHTGVFDHINISFTDLIVQKRHLYVFDRNLLWEYDLENKTWLRLNIRKDVFGHSGEKIENSNSTIRDIQYINDLLWISTMNDGMLFFDPHKHTIHSDTRLTDVVGPSHSTLNKMVIDPNGYMWSIAQPAQIIKSDVPVVVAKPEHPKIYLNEFKINNQVIQSSLGQNGNDALILKNYQRQIFFKYALINPPHKDSVKYSYQLKGFDKSWVETGTNRVANYSKLSSGKYSFHVRAGIGSDVVEIQLTQFEIPRYFYETWWFRALIAITVAAVIGIIYLLQRKRKKEIAQFHVQLKDMELQALRSQMNPHFLFNTLNSIKSYVLTKGPDEASDYLTKFSQLIRKILENSKQSLLSLEQELAAMKLYVEMEHLRFNKDFKYNFVVDPEINLQRFKIAPMIIQPYIENAIWHGLMNKRGAKQLDIIMSSVAGGVLCVIEDNGVGREEAQRLYADRPVTKKSLGMKITGDRVESINQLYGIALSVKIFDKIIDGQPTGTRVEIILPFIHQKAKV